MNNAERAYSAGILDGEGTISASARVQWLKRDKIWVRVVSKTVRVTNTDMRLLDWLQETTGCGKISKLWQNPNPKYERFRRGNIKPLYAWTLYPVEIKPFLGEIRKYLVLKGKQADLMIESLYLSKHRGSGKAYTDEVWQRQLEIHKEFRVLNQRGIGSL